MLVTYTTEAAVTGYRCNPVRIAANVARVQAAQVAATQATKATTTAKAVK